MVKFFYFFIAILFIFVCSSFCYAYRKIEYPDKSYVCVPSEIDEHKMNILVLLHGYIGKTNNFNNKKKNKEMNFDKEVFNWKFKANKEKFFIIGFDIDYDSFRSETADDILHYRITKKIKELHNEYKPLIIKKYIAGTQYGGAMAIYFHTKYDTFDGCLCMNGADIIPTAKRYLRHARNKKFYLFHGEQNRYVPMHTVNHTKKRLEQNKAIVYLKTYSELAYYLTSAVYSQAIDTILQEDDNSDLQECHSASLQDEETDENQENIETLGTEENMEDNSVENSNIENKQETEIKDKSGQE